MVGEEATVGDEDAELLVGDELVDERLHAEEGGDATTVDRRDAHDERHRPQQVGTDRLRQTGRIVLITPSDSLVSRRTLLEAGCIPARPPPPPRPYH